MSDMDFEDEGSDAFTVFTVTLSVRARLTESVYLFLLSILIKIKKILGTTHVEVTGAASITVIHHVGHVKVIRSVVPNIYTYINHGSCEVFDLWTGPF